MANFTPIPQNLLQYKKTQNVKTYLSHFVLTYTKLKLIGRHMLF